MYIKIINPNTTQRMTEQIAACARTVARPDTRIEAVSPAMGPASIESHYDEALALPGLLHEIAAGERDGVDGHVIACFGDPGLKAARELARGPVLGIAEAAMHAASMVGTRFSVVTTLSRTIGQARHLAEVYGMQRFCANVRACDIPVLALEKPGSNAKAHILAECRRALDEDDCDTIVLGCAGMAMLCDELGEQLGIPVIDGVAAAVTMLEALIAMRLGTSKRGELAHPIPKAINGILSGFTLDRHPPATIP